MNIKVIAGWAVIAFLCWWVAKEPPSAGHLVTNVGNFFANSASHLRNFVSGL